MKKIILLLICVLSVSISAKSLPIVQYDPFQKAKKLLKVPVIQKRVSSVKRKKLSVDAIFNKKAYINGKFYGVHRTVDGYKIIAIADEYIKVKKNRKIFVVPLIQSNKFMSMDKRKK